MRDLNCLSGSDFESLEKYEQLNPNCNIWPGAERTVLLCYMRLLNCVCLFVIAASGLSGMTYPKIIEKLCLFCVSHYKVC